MHQALEEEDLRFIVEAAKEKVKLDRERAYTMMEDSESPQDITNLFNETSRLERALDNIERTLDRTYFE